MWKSRSPGKSYKTLVFVFLWKLKTDVQNLGNATSDRDITGGELFKSKSRELVLKFWVNSYLLYWEIFFFVVACEYSRLSSLVATGDISRETCLGVRSMEGWLYSQIVLVGEKPEHQYLLKRHWRGKEIVRKHHKDIYLWVMYTFFLSNSW